MNPRTETIRRAEPEKQAGSGLGDASSGGDSSTTTWWDRLTANIHGISPTARDVLAADSTLLADLVAPRIEGKLDGAAFSNERVRTGIVVGSVQSGKTASMLAMAARVLDRGLDILVVLAGTRIALWVQTYERVLGQLDGSTPDSFHRGNGRRVLVPDPSDLLGLERANPRGYLRTQKRAMERGLKEGRPAILIIPKEDDHLIELARVLRDVVSARAVGPRSKPVELVVLDDEADDASVLDATQPEKLTPRLIQRLWSNPAGDGETFSEVLYATYVAYTATPQANFVQSAHNPLAPRSFRFVLRTPDQMGILEPRELTYEEPLGIRAYYTGGRTFYERLRGKSQDFCVAYPFPLRGATASDEEHAARFRQTWWRILGDSVRAYLVAGAVRLATSERRLSQVGQEFPTREDLEKVLPAPHCMLFHPSALTDSHFATAADLSRWSNALPGGEDAADPVSDEAGRPVFSSRGLADRLAAENDAWRAWLARYSETGELLRFLPQAAYGQLQELEWATVEQLLRTEVFPFVRLKVINSDPSADDRPGYEPRRTGSGWAAPPDLMSVLVAGNILSRGLTIEGLTTSVFLRGASDPAADTQMQMQRWFGYRGQYLPLCRVFLFQDQLELFRAYHSNDEALRQDVLRNKDIAVDVVVLEGHDFVATAKVRTKQAPLHPGPTPSVRLVEHADEGYVQGNLTVVAELVENHEFVALNAPPGSVRGLISTAPVELSDVAGILDRFRYTTHDPDPSAPLYLRWQALQARLEIPDPLLRTPGQNPAAPSIDPRMCPYSIAAYLRLWDALLERRQAPGLYPTDAPSLGWHMIDLTSYQRTRPRFYLGVRFGEGGLCSDHRLASRGVRVMTRGLSDNRDCVLETLWGTRGSSTSYFGDQLFDYHQHGSTPVPNIRDGALWRPRGHPGLVLFHIIRKGNVDMVAVGLALPHGGPDHIAALRGSRD
jgi:hypothetical protein